MIKDNARGQVIYWLATGAFLVFLMVLIGGITRLTGSGLSMVDWKLIMGAIPPLNDLEWQEAFKAYQLYPEYQIQSSNFGLSEFKSIFFWEYSHRLLGRLMGLIFIIPFIYFIVTKKISGIFILKLIFLLFLGGLQGFFGWYMVKSGLVNDPHVSHFRLALHLVTAFATFSYIWWLILGLILPYQLSKTYKTIYPLTIIFLVILFFQITYGGFVAGLKAGYFYNTWPKMGDQWIAESVYAMKPLYLNFIEGIAGVQFIHRSIAIVIFFFELVFFYISYRMPLGIQLKNAMKLGLLVVLLQELLGILALLFAVPLSMGILHQIGAFLLLMRRQTLTLSNLQFYISAKMSDILLRHFVGNNHISELAQSQNIDQYH